MAIRRPPTTFSDTISTADIADDQVTYAKMQDTSTANRVLGAASAGTIGEVQVVTDMIADNAINLDKLAHLGTDGHVLTSTGTGSAPAFEALPTGDFTEVTTSTSFSGSDEVHLDLGVHASGQIVNWVIYGAWTTSSGNPSVKVQLSTTSNTSITSNYLTTTAGNMTGTTTVNEIADLTDCIARPRNGHNGGDKPSTVMTMYLTRHNGFYTATSQWSGYYNANSMEVSICSGVHTQAYGSGSNDDKNICFRTTDGSNFRSGVVVIYSAHP